MITVGHIWADYMPQTFVEPHPYLLEDPEFNSFNFAATVWFSGKRAYEYLFYLSKGRSENLVNPSIIRRTLNKLGSEIRWQRFNLFCTKILREKNISLIHVHFGTTAARVLSALDKTQLPVIVTFYGVDASAALKNHKWLRLYSRMYERVDRILVLCETVKDRLVESGCPSQKIEVWNLPAGIEKYIYKERNPGKETRFIISARFAEKKGYNILLPAFRRLLDSGRKAKLTIIGYGNQNKMESLIKSLNMENDVSVHDTKLKGDFAAFYSSLLNEHDIFVLPSIAASDGDDEGGPSLTLVCAQAAGLPVICTPFPGAEITVLEGESGFYCKENNMESLVDKMLYLNDHPELWTPFGKRGHEIVCKNFSAKTQMERLKGIYRDLSKKR